MSNINLTLSLSLARFAQFAQPCVCVGVQFKNTQRYVTSTYAIYVTPLHVRQVQITERERGGRESADKDEAADNMSLIMMKHECV